MVLHPQEIISLLHSAPWFKSLSEDELQILVPAWEQHRYGDGEVIFRQDMPPGALYLVAEGQVCEQTIDRAGLETFRKTYAPGEFVGGDALARGQTHHGTAVAVGETLLLQLPAADLGRLQAQHPELRDHLLRSEIAGCLRAMPLFGQLSDTAIRDVAKLARVEHLKPQQLVVRRGQRNTPLRLIRCGQVGVWRDEEVHVRTAGDFVGEEAVLYDQPSPVTGKALTPLEVYILSAEDLRWLLEVYPALRAAFRHPDTVDRLRHTALFGRLTGSQLQHLAGYVRWIHYPKGYMVTSQGHPGSSFFILDQGQASIRSLDRQGREQPRAHLEAGQSFGETSLFVGDLRDASVEAVAGTDWLVLSRRDFQLALESRRDILRRLQLRPDTSQRIEQPTFPWLEEGEVVVHVVRRHPLIAVLRLTPPALAAIVLSLLMAAGLLPPLLAIVLLFIDALYAGWQFADWRNDYMVITSRRLAHREQIWPVRERTVEAPLRQIQDVTVTRGFLGNFFRYGRVQIQTAAAVGMIRFSYTPDPMGVKETILERVARARAGAQAAQRETVRRSLDRRLEFGLELNIPLAAVPSPDLPRRPRAKPGGLGRWYRLPWLRRTEPDRITWRKHWLRLVARTWLPLLVGAGLVATAVLVLLPQMALLPSRAAFWLPWSVLSVIILTWLWWEYIDWSNDVYIVTQERIIDVEKKPLFFSEERREASLGMVQNVTYNIPGPLAYLFGFGHVEIYTAAETGRFDFLYVPNPREVQAEVFRRIEQYRRAEEARQAQQRQTEIADWFEMYHRATTGKQ